MGSSKKKKEKKSKRHRSRSRSQSKSKSQSPPPSKHRESRKRKHRNDEDAEEKEKKKIIGKQVSFSESIPEKKLKRNDGGEVEEGEIEEDELPTVSSSGGGGDVSMSIEETNKLRAQLGLAPLEVESKTEAKTYKDSDGKTLNVVKVDGSEFVHKPADNWARKREADSIKEKLAALREKRKLDEKLGAVKSLYDEDGEDSAASWIEKSRKLEAEKKLAALREKMLAQMDEDYAKEAAEEEQKKKKPMQKKEKYTSRDLAGMTVQHAKGAFLEDHETILVLQDKDVLDESEDILMNPTIAEQEKWKKNAELRKQKPGYNPYEEDLDEFGMPKRNLLSKYDEEIDGEKKESFKLSASGNADIQAERERAEMLAKLKEGAESLEIEPLKLATEYLTHEEMAQFKKPKKRVKKLRKRTTEGLKADDLLAIADTVDEDFGSRHRGRGRRKPRYETAADDDAPEIKNERDEEAIENDVDGEPMDIAPMDDDDLANIVLSDDEAEQELQAALSRARQMQQNEAKKTGVEKVVELLPKREPEDEEDEIPDLAAPVGTIVMDSVSQYCRGLGEPTYGVAGNQDDVEDDDMIDVEREATASTSKHKEDEDEDMEDKGGWYERDINDTDRPRSTSSSESDDDSREPILEEEPDMTNMGVAAALKLAVQKGYLKDEKNRGGSRQLEHLKAQRYSIVEKQFHDIDDKFAKKLERMGGGGGPIVDFKEKSTYKPDVKLEYADEKGRLLDQKEAFRYLSWKFHGKKSGKRKTEKRSKKLAEKELFNEMSSTDTPLGTLTKQIEKQRQLQTPFIVLSGTGSKDAGTAIKKD